MKQVNVHEAKSTLSQLLADVESGEEILIARAGKPVAKLIGIAAEPEGRVYRKPGAWKGKVRFAPDYDEADAEILADFEASINAPLGSDKA